MKKPIARKRSLPRNVWVMTLASFLTDVSSDMVNNLVPLFLLNALGARTATVGLVEGLAESTSSFIKLLSGWWSDRVVSRKPPTVAGYAISAFSKPLLAFAGSWVGVLAVRFGDRLGKGVRTAPRDALLADSVAPEQRGAAFGFHRAGDSLGAVFGLALALLVVWLTQGNQIELSRATFQRIALLSAIPALLAVVVLLIGLKDRRRAAPASGQPILGSFRSMPRDFRLFLAVFGLFTLGNSADAFVVLRAQERGLSVAAVLTMLLAFNVIYTLVAGPAGQLSDRIGRPRLILAGWAVYALIYLGLAVAGEGWQVAALFITNGVYYGLVEGSARAYVADLAGSEGRGTAYGLYHAVVGFIALPASLIAGVLWQGIGAWGGFGPAAPFLFGAALSGLAAVLFLALLHPLDPVRQVV